MSTIVQMPVRVKPPPAETGEIISPGCASFETTMPSNGARMIVSSTFCALQVDLPLRGRELVALRGEPRAAASSCARARSRSARLEISLRGQPLGAVVVELRLADPHARLLERTAPPRSPRPARARVPCEAYEASSRAAPARLHLHAFLDEDLDDLAGDFRRDRGLPARGHVAAGVEHRAARLRPRPPRRRDAHFLSRCRACTQPSTISAATRSDRDDDPDTRLRRSRVSARTVDAQTIESCFVDHLDGRHYRDRAARLSVDVCQDSTSFDTAQPQRLRSTVRWFIDRVTAAVVTDRFASCHQRIDCACIAASGARTFPRR